jgi:hypothetical protein
VGAREDISSAPHTKHRKEKLEPVRQTPAKMTDVIPGSSTTKKLPTSPSTYRPPTILPEAERTGMTMRCPTCLRMPRDEISGSSNPHSILNFINFRKPSGRKNQLIERKMEDKLREELGQMKIEQSKMQQEHREATSRLLKLEQENEELKKSLTEKEVQLRYAQENHPTNNIILPVDSGNLAMLRQLIEHPVWSPILHRLLIFSHNISSRQKQATGNLVRHH